MLKAAMWAFVGVGGQQAMRLVVVLVLARLLTPEEFGIVAIAQTILSFAEVLQQMGLGSALVQTDRLSKKMERSALSAVLVTSLAICGAIYLFVDEFARWFQTPELPQIMPLLLLSFLLTALNGPSIMLLNREMRFRELAIWQLAAYIVGYGAVAVTLAWLGFSYWSLIWATLVQTVLYFIAVHWLRPVWPTLRPDWGDLKLLFNFGGGMMLAQVLNKVARRGDNLVVAATLGSAPLGYYSRAYSLMDMANQLFGTVLYKVLFPAFSERRRTGGKKAARMQTYLRSQFVVSILMMPGSVLMVLLGPEIVYLLLGPMWGAAGEALRFLGAAMYFRLAYKVSTAYVHAEGAVYRNAAIQLVYAVLVACGAWIGSGYGIVGVAVGVGLAIVCQFLLLTWLVVMLNHGGWGELTAAISPAFIASLVAVGPAYAVHEFAVAHNYHAAIIVLIVGSIFFGVFGSILISVILLMGGRIPADLNLSSTLQKVFRR